MNGYDAALAVEDTQQRTVRVACGINKSLYLDEDGNLTGLCAGYLQQLALNNNWKLEYVEGSWNDSVQKLYDGKIDLLFPAQKTEDRIDKMGFSDYIGGYQQIGLFAKEDADIYYNDYEHFNNKKIAISNGTNDLSES